LKIKDSIRNYKFFYKYSNSINIYIVKKLLLLFKNQYKYNKINIYQLNFTKIEFDKKNWWFKFIL
jgi:hypothetical protein